eukprot:4105565-Amphidinium_carterae.3
MEVCGQRVSIGEVNWTSTPPEGLQDWMTTVEAGGNTEGNGAALPGNHEKGQDPGELLQLQKLDRHCRLANLKVPRNSSQWA